MPFGDGTGPMGLGPMTGRAAGFCAGFGRSGFANPIPRRWSGFGRRIPWGTPMPAGMATHIMVGLTLHSLDFRMHTHHGGNNKGKI